MKKSKIGDMAVKEGFWPISFDTAMIGIMVAIVIFVFVVIIDTSKIAEANKQEKEIILPVEQPKVESEYKKVEDSNKVKTVIKLRSDRK